MRIRSRVWRMIVAVVLLCQAGSVRAEQQRGSLQIKGSDTMVNLVQAWAEAFMEQHPEVMVAVTGGGSGTGIAALISGTCDLAAASRQMTQTERDQAAKQGAAPEEVTVALDGLAVVVHPGNPIKTLTIPQLADLFTGTVTNWQQLGGPNRTVILLSREVNSGTHVYFKEHVLGGGKEFSPDALLMPSSQAIADEVATNPGGIGYYGMGYLNPKNTAVAVARAEGQPYVLPSEETVRSGNYPISRPLFLYTRGAPEGLVKAFIEFVRSPAGQDVVREQDFVPLEIGDAGG